MIFLCGHRHVALLTGATDVSAVLQVKILKKCGRLTIPFWYTKIRISMTGGGIANESDWSIVFYVEESGRFCYP